MSESLDHETEPNIDAAVDERGTRLEDAAQAIESLMDEGAVDSEFDPQAPTEVNDELREDGEMVPQYTEQEFEEIANTEFVEEEPQDEPPQPQPPADPEAAEQARRVAEAQAQTARNLQQMRDQYSQQFVREFPNIKTPEDLLSLQEADPAGFQRASALLQVGQAKAMEAEQAQEFAKQAFVRGEVPRIQQMIPDWDVVKGDVWEYGLQRGYSPDQLAYARAEDLAVLNDARMATQATRARTEVRRQVRRAPQPTVRKPTARRPSKSRTASQSAAQRHRKEQSVESAADVFERYFDE